MELQGLDKTRAQDQPDREIRAHIQPHPQTATKTVTEGVKMTTNQQTQKGKEHYK